MPAATFTLTQRLLAPADDAPYTVQTITTPASGMQIPQALIEQFQLPPERAEAAQRRAASAQQTGTWLTPRDWQGAVVLLIPGTGDNRHAFKYQLFRKLLDRGRGIHRSEIRVGIRRRFVLRLTAMPLFLEKQFSKSKSPAQATGSLRLHAVGLGRHFGGWRRLQHETARQPPTRFQPKRH